MFLLDLFLRPSRVFSREDYLTSDRYILPATWIAGIASLIDRLDTKIVGSELSEEGRENDRLWTVLADDWIAFWAFTLVGGILSGYLLWLIAGWWYRKRLEWSGADTPDARRARVVWAFQNLIWAIPSVLVVIFYTVAYDNYLQAWDSDPWVALLLIPFLFWSCIVSYTGATTAFTLNRGRAALWFIALPLVFYTLTIGAVGILYAVFANE